MAISTRPTWPLRQLVEVEWDDSLTYNKWASVAEHKEGGVIGPYRSLGYLVYQDRHVVQIAQSMSAVTQNVTDSITIPRVAVHRVKRIGNVE